MKIEKFILTIATFMLLANQAIAKVQVGRLTPYLGVYKLKNQSQGQETKIPPCVFNFPELIKSYGVKLSQKIISHEEANDVEHAGDFRISLEAYYDGIQKWVDLFDDVPQFMAINRGIVENLNISSLSSVSNDTVWDPKKLRLSQVHRVSRLGRTGYSKIQTIYFSQDQKEFMYRYWYEARDSFGRLTSQNLVYQCIFQKI